jgi:nucleoid DNA-binding protein
MDYGVTQKKLAKLTANKHGLTIKETAKYLKCINSSIHDLLLEGHKVRFEDFYIYLQKVEPRTRYNPYNGERYDAGPTYILKIKPLPTFDKQLKAKKD